MDKEDSGDCEFDWWVGWGGDSRSTRKRDRRSTSPEMDVLLC